MNATAPDFEARFAREIVESERLRMALLAGLFGLVMVMILLFAWIFRDGPAPFLRSPQTPGYALAITGGLVAYELLARHVLGRFLRRGGLPPPGLRYLNALLETSVPSFLILVVAREVEPIAVLQGPAAFLYAVFIVLSTLRLDFALSAFTGVVAATEFAALSFFYATQGGDAGAAEILTAPGFILAKALVLLFSGVAAGFVTGQLRRRIAKAFHAVQERQRVFYAFGQQVSPAIVDELLRQGPELASRKSFVCVMFMDIRDFTSKVERLSPEEIVAFQNTVFGVGVEVVNRHHGVINQFLGDGFMATFGAPLSSGDDCRDAVAAARELVARIETRIGIGLHAGDAVSGNVGSALRKQYSITGSVVILASRIEQLNKEYGSQILVSGEVLQRCGDQGAGAVALGPVHIKGRRETIEIHRIA